MGIRCLDKTIKKSLEDEEDCVSVKVVFSLLFSLLIYVKKESKNPFPIT